MQDSKKTFRPVQFPVFNEKKRPFFSFRSALFAGLYFFFAFPGLAQKIKRTEYDAAKNQWRVETAAVNLKTAPGVKMDVALQAVGSSFLLRLSGAGLGANTVIAGDELIFLLDNDSTVTIKSPTVQNVDRSGRSYAHEYTLLPADLDALSRHDLQALRKYSTEGYEDIYVDKDAAGRLKELSNAFAVELRKNKQLLPSAAPGFPGGKNALLAFLNRNLKQQPLLETGERKFALFQFSIGTDGSVNDLAVKHSGGDALDDEMLRIFKRMPKWKPATEGGKRVEAIVMQPVTVMKTESGVRVVY